MFSRRRNDISYEADQVDAIMPGSRSSYLLIRILGTLAVLVIFSLGGSAILDLGGDDRPVRRPVLELAGPTLALGADGVELLKRLGGSSCSAADGSQERWVFRVRLDVEETADGSCVADEGDLVVWVTGRRITAF